MTAMVEIESLSKLFPARAGSGEVRALDRIDLTIAQGEFCVLVGDSGSGKTTLMRSIAGLERPSDGRIRLRGETVCSVADGIFVPPQARRIGMVFQSYAIWPHLTVAENVGLALKTGINRCPPAEARTRVADALHLVGLDAQADRPAPALSGGQQQRVALARALAVSTDLLVMDEPMSNLDARLREEVRAQIRDVTRRFGSTAIYVTHDQAEAMALADRIVIMRDGRIMAAGTPQDLYDRCPRRAVADFFGLTNYLDGAMAGPGRLEHPQLGTFEVASDQPAGPACFGLRADDCEIVGGPGPNTVPGRITDEVYRGGHSLVAVDAAGCRFHARARGRHAIGEQVFIAFPAAALRRFDDEETPTP